MSTDQAARLTGEVISVNHSVDCCRITIELKGDLSQTAAIMKQSLVTLGVAEGTPVFAAVDATHMLVDVVRMEDDALPC